MLLHKDGGGTVYALAVQKRSEQRLCLLHIITILMSVSNFLPKIVEEL